MRRLQTIRDSARDFATPPADTRHLPRICDASRGSVTLPRYTNCNLVPQKVAEGESRSRFRPFRAEGTGAASLALKRWLLKFRPFRRDEAPETWASPVTRRRLAPGRQETLRLSFPTSLPINGSAPQGQRHVAWRRQPQGRRFPRNPRAPKGRRQSTPSHELPSPPWGLGSELAFFLGLTPQATCLGSFGASHDPAEWLTGEMCVEGG